MRRELWETITELVEGLAVPQEPASNLHVTGMTVDLPIELVVVQTRVGFRLLVDAPHYRWDVGLRPDPGRLRLNLQELDEEETAWLAQYGTSAPARHGAVNTSEND